MQTEWIKPQLPSKPKRWQVRTNDKHFSCIFRSASERNYTSLFWEKHTIPPLSHPKTLSERRSAHFPCREPHGIYFRLCGSHWSLLHILLGGFFFFSYNPVKKSKTILSSGVVQKKACDRTWPKGCGWKKMGVTIRLENQSPGGHCGAERGRSGLSRSQPPAAPAGSSSHPARGHFRMAAPSSASPKPQDALPISSNSLT